MSNRKSRLILQLELIGMFPFVLAGKLYGRLFPLRTKTSIFLFFSSADIGGAVKVNADIVNCIRNKDPLIIFSKRPKNNGFSSLFTLEKERVLDLHRKIDNKLYHFVNFFYRGVLASWINQAENPVVFGGENLFFYKVIPHIRRSIPRIELCHLDTWLPYSIAFIDLIDKRVTSTVELKEKILKQYREDQIPSSYMEKVSFIENRIDIPEYKEVNNPQLEVVFIGRGAPQKRVHLIAAIAKEMHTRDLPAHFSFVGDVENVIDPAKFPYCTFYGNVRDDARMQEIYQQSDVLLLTSAYEGLPLVVMYMMAYGKVVVSTAVNGIPDYITHLDNGLLIRATVEEAVVSEGVSLLRALIEDPALKTKLGKRSAAIAIQKFGGELFCHEYRQLLVRGS